MIAALSSVAAAAPFNDLDEMLIPLVAIIGGISVPIVALILSYRKQKLQATLIERAIEQGLTVEEIDELMKRQGFQEGKDKNGEGQESSGEPNFRKGLVLIAVGAAFFLAENPYIYGGGWHDGFIGPPGKFVAFLLMGLGVAIFASDLLAVFLGKSKDR